MASSSSSPWRSPQSPNNRSPFPRHRSTQDLNRKGTNKASMLPSSTQHSAGSFASFNLQSHLYDSFINQKTPDIVLAVRGRGWQAEYSLHRVVLIQSGFFRSLFTSGFLESSRQLSPTREDGLGEVDVRFDDPNITKSAFELCIARLYGGGPALHLSPEIQPTLSRPLTPCFPNPPALPAPPPGEHPATPRFLLSLLSTSIYLGIPTITSHALSLVLSSIGPYTVVRYLGFAIGNGIGEWEPGDLPSAVGLEHIGKPLPDRQGSVKLKQSTISSESSIAESGLKVEGSVKEGADAEEVSPTSKQGDSSFSKSDTVSEEDEYDDDYGPSFFYGSVGDTIGEACACWLVRWGADVLPHEEEVAGIHPDASKTYYAYTPYLFPPSSPGVSPFLTPQAMVPRALSPLSPITSTTTSPRRATLPSSIPPRLSAAPSGRRTSFSQGPIIWSLDGLDAKWIRAVISSDEFFIKGEFERYTFATRVVDLRRKAFAAEKVGPRIGDLDLEKRRMKEEREWSELFKTGIYYGSMTLEDLMRIRRDFSPHTSKPYVPLSIIQQAHWSQSILRSQVMNRNSSSGSNNPLSRSASPAPALSIGSNANASSSSANLNQPRELGVTATTTELKNTPLFDDEQPKVYFPVPKDSSSRLGNDSSSALSDPSGNATPGAITSDSLLFGASTPTPGTPGPSGTATVSANKLAKAHADEANFFGIMSNRRTLEDLTKEDPTGKARWTENEPFRFSVEFWGVEGLKEKQRLHSHTVWYAGSRFNVYVQVVRKKGLQLGIYLHRSSFVDPIPAPSAPPAIQSPTTTTSPPPNPFSAPTSPPTSQPLASSPPRYTSLGFPVPRPSTPSSPLNSPSRSSFFPHSGSTTALPTIPASGSASAIITPTSSNPAPQTQTSPTTAPPAPWRDPRLAIRAYFSISCFSANGSSLTKFASAPDTFSVAQSWGWKSSGLDIGEEEAAEVERGSECSLRATVMLGIV